MATFAFNTDVLRMFYLSELYHMEKYVFVLFMNHLFLPANFYHWIEKNRENRNWWTDMTELADKIAQNQKCVS